MRSQNASRFRQEWFSDCGLLDRVLCELCVEYSATSSVALSGPVATGARRLMMTQMPSGFWLARLLLMPGENSARVHVAGSADDANGHTAVSRSWDVDFSVPNLVNRQHVTPEVRIWLPVPGTAAGAGKSCEQS